MLIRLFVVAVLALAPATEPAPRRLPPLPLQIDQPLAHVSAARELPDGRVILTNDKGAAVLLLDPGTGKVARVGDPGGGADRYARPGGLYPGPSGTTLMIDRGQTRVFTISASGQLQGSRSIAQRDVTMSSSSDIDLQRVDAAGLVYVLERDRRGSIPTDGPAESTIVRFDADSQQRATIATLRGPEQRVISAGDGATLWRGVIGSPTDGWGVAPDGRIAVVRADPYRVEWYGREGGRTQGPVIVFAPVPMTERDREHHRQTRAQGGGAAVAVSGGSKPASSGSGPEMLFAPTKAPFRPEDVIVSPDGRVWVGRSGELDAPAAVFDVFDGAGRRVDRVALPAGSRIVGFGSRAIYVRQGGADGIRLLKYGVQ